MTSTDYKHSRLELCSIVVGLLSTMALVAGMVMV